MLEVDWTRAGKQAIEGRDYGYFSGEFMLDQNGEPMGLDPNQRPIGALVNDPAFENIQRIAASKAVTPNQETEMPENTDLTPLVEAGLLKADEAKREDAVKVAASRFTESKDTTEFDKLKAAKAEVDKEVETLKAEIAKRDEADALKFVADAVEAGKIKPKDEEAKAEWAKVYASNPDTAKRLIGALPSITDGLKPIERTGKPENHREGSDYTDKVAAARAEAKEKGVSVVEILRGQVGVNYGDYRNSLGN